MEKEEEKKIKEQENELYLYRESKNVEKKKLFRLVFSNWSKKKKFSAKPHNKVIVRQRNEKE